MADKTSRILDVKYFILLPSVDYVGSPYDNILWGALLRSASAYEMYRKRHGRIDPQKIVEFLLLDPQFHQRIFGVFQRLHTQGRALLPDHGRHLAE